MHIIEIPKGSEVRFLMIFPALCCESSAVCGSILRYNKKIVFNIGLENMKVSDIDGIINNIYVCMWGTSITATF